MCRLEYNVVRACRVKAANMKVISLNTMEGYIVFSIYLMDLMDISGINHVLVCCQQGDSAASKYNWIISNQPHINFQQVLCLLIALNLSKLIYNFLKLLGFTQNTNLNMKVLNGYFDSIVNMCSCRVCVDQEASL